MSTPLLSLPEIQENQASKYITHNEGIALIEALITRVLSRSNSGPPTSFSNGDTYIIDSATGVWENGSVNDIAHYYDSGWHFITPVEGLSIRCVDEGNQIYFDGTFWSYNQYSKISQAISLSDQDAVGVVGKMTVASNSQGFGAVMRVDTSGEAQEANATDESGMPGLVLALESGTGSDKNILHWGRVRNDSWSWTPGAYVYVGTSAGQLTQTRPSNTDNIVQVVGVAESTTILHFNPSFVTIKLL